MDGNFSSMSGNSPGCHGAHSEHYIRRVQVNKDEEAGQIYAKYNPESISESVWSNNNSDIIISFPISSKKGSIYKNELYGVKHLEIVKNLQENWVKEGSNQNNDIFHRPFVFYLFSYICDSLPLSFHSPYILFRQVNRINLSKRRRYKSELFLFICIFPIFTRL